VQDSHTDTDRRCVAVAEPVVGASSVADPTSAESTLDNRGKRRRRETYVAWAIVGALALSVMIMFVAVRARADRIAEERERGLEAGRPPAEVVVREIEPQEVVDRISLPGVVEAWEDVWVSAEVRGVVVFVAAEKGDEVAPGDILCRLDGRDYEAGVDGARAALELAEAGCELAESQLARITRLRDEGAVNKAEHEAADAAARQSRARRTQARSALKQAELSLARTEIRAPMSGTVSDLSVSVGQLVSSGNPVARIVDLRKVKVVAGIPERDVLAAQKLEEADATIASLGRTFVGRKAYLGVQTGDRARVYRMELAVDNGERLIRPGMFATVDVVRGVRRNAVVVPLYSVVPRKKDKVVFVEEGGIARKREIVLGILLDREVEVTEGLRPGERLIVIGQRSVEDGDAVDVREPPEALKELIR
jgi:RND family efflux transporter MFP subunit